MTTDTVLTPADKDNFVSDLVDYGTDFVAPLYAVVESIEQAVLQSPEVQRLREDAERYRWLRKRMIAVDFEYGDPKCIALAFEMPSRDMVFSADCDANVDLGMEQQP